MFKRFSDKTIIEGIKTQDDKILNWLYDNYFQTVRSHVMRNSGSAEDVSDVFQDSIIVLYNQICDDSLKLTGDLKGYFFGIAKNIWSSNLRKRKQTMELNEDLPEPDPDDSNDPMFERIMSRAFQKLKPDSREILTLFSDGKTYDEIAEKMDLKNEAYARRKKYLCKEELLELVKEDPEYQEYLRFLK